MDAEVARMSAGALTEEDVEGLRPGNIPDPTVGWVAETLAMLSYETAAAILRESSRLPEREKRGVLRIVREFGDQPE